MNRPGLSREERTFLNRMMREYQKDDLPNPEQIRFDAGRLAGLVLRLNDQIEKMMRRQV
jgi:hypothetical protein